MRATKRDLANDILSLPRIRDEVVPARLLVRNAVALLLSLLGLLALIAFVAGAVIQVDGVVQAGGSLSPSRIWPVRSLEDGFVMQVHVAEGDSVDVGSALVTLDTIDVGQSLRRVASGAREARLNSERAAAAIVIARQQLVQRRIQAEAVRARSRAALQSRMIDFGISGSVDSVLSSKAGAHIALDIVRADVVAAETELEAIEVEQKRLIVDELDIARQRNTEQALLGDLADARARRERHTIQAANAGTVLTSRLETLPGSAVRRGDVLMEIADRAKWQADLFVDERSIDDIREGQRVQLEIPALARVRQYIMGNITSISGHEDASGAPVRPGAYRVVASVAPESLRALGADLRRGYSVQARIVTRSGPIVALFWQRIRNR